MSASTPVIMSTNLLPLQALPGVVYPSDAWLATLAPCRTADLFFDFNAYALANKYAFIYLGTQPGDYANLKALYAAGAAVLAAGKPLCMQVRRNQTVTLAQIGSQVLIMCGTSPALPVILMATPDIQNPRPIFEGRLSIGNPHGVVQNVVIDAPDFYDPLADPSNPLFAGAATSAQESGIYLVSNQANNHILVQDARVQFMQGGFDIEGIGNDPLSTIILHRCTVANCYGQRWGLYVSNTQDLLTLDCIFAHNGYAAPVGKWPGVPKAVTNQNIYLQSWDSEYIDAPYLNANPMTRTIGLISADPAAEGIEQRTGGLIDTAVFLGCPITGLIGATGGPAVVMNVVIDFGGGAFDLTSGPGGGVAWGFLDVCSPSVDFLNIYGVNQSPTQPAPWVIGLQCTATQDGVAIAAPTDANLLKCIVVDPSNKSFSVTSGTAGKIVFEQCVLPGTTAANGIITNPTFVNAAWTVGKYFASLGIPGVVDAPSGLKFIVANQRRGNWNALLTAQAIVAAAAAELTVLPAVAA